jgi:hypothetical protein
LHKTIVPIREEPLPEMSKKVMASDIERKFFRPKSVFAPWKPDNAKIINTCTETDLLAMNISKIIKTPEDLAKLTKAITHHMPFIKNCHLDLLCETNIPPFV